MKQLLLLTVFLWAFISHALQAQVPMEVVGGEVWTYPVLQVKHQIMEETRGGNHFLSSVLEQDLIQTKERVAQIKLVHPDKLVKVYRLDYVEAQVEIPNHASAKMSYIPLSTGWSAKLSYLAIPQAELLGVKAFLKQNAGVRLTVSHYQRAQKEVTVFSADCRGDGPETEGVMWLYERMKLVEKRLAEERRVEGVEQKELLNNFVERCLSLDARNVAAFKDFSEAWRVLPREGAFEIKELQVQQNYRQLNVPVGSSLVVYEY